MKRPISNDDLDEAIIDAATGSVDLSFVKEVAEAQSVPTKRVRQRLDHLIRRGWLVKGDAPDTIERPVFIEENLELANLQEDSVWSELFRPTISPWLDADALRICTYAFTEMLNNAIDHSEGQSVLVVCEASPRSIVLSIIDDGVGIFRKIRRSVGLDTDREALFELTKGKLTTDSTRHTGEGIFFTSRACSNFWLFSRGLTLSLHEGADSTLESEEERSVSGTAVRMEIPRVASRKLHEVFEQFAAGEELSFNRTEIVLGLAKDKGDLLISRSQAKRVMARLEQFEHVCLDFEGVEEIGQGFADEIFRVWRREHPNVTVVTLNESERVKAMIRRVTAGQTF